MDDIADAAEATQGKLAKYFEVSSDLAVVALVLDPRYKMEYYGEPGNPTYVDHLNILKRVWERYKVGDNFAAIHQVSAAGPSFLKKRKLSHPADELDKYLSQPLEDTTIHPLHWWKAQLGYIGLRRMARDVLAIPATSASSERCFSQGRIIMPFNRCRLNPETMEALNCLRNWRRGYYEAIGIFEKEDEEGTPD